MVGFDVYYGRLKIMKKLIMFTSSGIGAPSSRIRGFKMAMYLSEYGVDSKTIFNMYESVEGNVIKRSLHRFKDFFQKIDVVAKSDKEAVIYIQRGVYLGLSNFSLFFSLISKFILRRKVIYDIDDGLFLIEPFPINSLIKFSDAVIAGGHELFNYAKKYNDNVFLIPTCVDLTNYLSRDDIQKDQGISLGFVGSPSTTKNLNLLLKPLEVLAKRYDIELRVISAPSYDDYWAFSSLFEEFEKRGVRVNLIPWTVNDEFYQLKNIDIGLDPLLSEGWEIPTYLSNKDWIKYKCGFKIINYMAAGVPTVASDTSENSYIIQNGLNGFLCHNDDEWTVNLRKLIEDKTLRKNMSANAKKSVEEKYSMRENARILARILCEL